MSASLHIQLLGGFAVTLGGQSIRAFRTAKTRALLAYLVVEADRQQSRTKLATLLWGELPDVAAKTNLRIELSNLKSLLADHPALEVSRNEVFFNRALATTDVHVFQRTIAAFLALPIETQGAELAKLTAALDLYQGEFLAGLHLNDAAEFEDWQLLTREQLHEEMMLALKTLQIRYAEQGRWAELADAARRQLAIVPWTESAHRNLMQALAAQGQMQAALAQFEKCRQILQTELGIAPSLATIELAARLRRSGLSQAAAQHNLTQQLKAFVGRKEEIDQVRKAVRVEKVVTLLGIGGVGKSHLAQTVAQNSLHDFADGVWFVPLTNVEAGDAAPERIALAIAAVVGFQVSNMQTPLAELAAHLASKEMLLVLDNWDHLAESAPVVLNALVHESAIHVLATSRLRLLIEGECVIQLKGLPRQEAYTLFVERARRVVTSFATDGNGPADGDILAICEQLAGLPLGIELAASWVEHYSVAEIVQSIGNVAVQPQQTEGLLQRHHKLSSVFEVSWQLLSLRQQLILARLSVFRGGFDRAAVTLVAESSLNDLSTLIAHSLVQRVVVGRYDLHPQIQELAAGKLARDEELELYTQYSHHYLLKIINTLRAEWASRLRLDFENIRTAWQRAVNVGDAAIIQQAATPFGDYMAHFGLLPDGERLFQVAAARFDGVAEHHELVARLLEQQSNFAHPLYGMKVASLLQQRMLTLTNDRALRIKTHSNLANYYAEIGAWNEADAHFDSITVLAEASSDLGIYIRSVENRIRVNALHFRGDFAEGIARLEEMIGRLARAPEPIADAENIHRALLSTLTGVTMRYGDYALAMHYCHENLTRLSHLGPQRERVQMLSGLALAEQYAGMYDEAIGHHLEAFALAKEIGDTDDMGILKVNLCLTQRQRGQLDEALAYGVEAVEILSKLGHERIEGQARNRVGHTLSVMGRWADADAAYGEALVVWEPLQHPNRYEAVAGRAVAALRLGRHTEALAFVDEVLDFVASKGLVGIVEPVRLLLNCEVVLTELGQTERGHNTLQQADAWVQTIAGRISDAGVREAFLNNRPDNQLLQRRILSRPG